MKKKVKPQLLVSLVAVVLLLGSCVAASAQQVEFQQTNKSVFVGGRGARGEFIFLNAQRITPQAGDGESEVATISIFIGAPVFPPFGRNFFARVPAGDIQIDVGNGTASVFTTVPGLGPVNVTFQQTGGVTQTQQEFQIEGPDSQRPSQFSTEAISRPTSAQGTLGPSTVRSTASAIMETDFQSQTQ